MNCPNCSAEMEHLGFEGRYGPAVEVDLCFPCHLLWLDRGESIQLSPGGTLDLFRALHEHRDDPRHALAGSPRCPRCDKRMSLLNDIGKAGRFSYYRCPAKDGRLTPFSEFLKEKEFVRSLTPLEQQKLRAEVKHVDCSGCGATVDLARGFQCEHCGSPLTVLDADAVARTLAELHQKDAERKAVDPGTAETRARALAAMETMRTQPRDEGVAVFSSGVRQRNDSAHDLLSASIGFLFGGFR